MSTYSSYQRDYYERVTKPRRAAERRASGRPQRQIPEGDPLIPVTVRLPATTLDRLRALAAERGCTLSAVITGLLTDADPA